MKFIVIFTYGGKVTSKEPTVELKRYFLLMVLVLALSGCAKTDSKVSGETYVTIEGFMQSYMQTFNSRDVNMLVAYYDASSLTYVLNDAGGYYLTRQYLLKALELKKPKWEKINLRLTDFNVDGASALPDGLTRAVITFDVESDTWIGTYNVVFALAKKGNSFLIVKENI